MSKQVSIEKELKKTALGCCDFINIILPDLDRISEKAFEAEQKKKKLDLNESEKFIHQVFLHYSDINDKFNDLEISKQSISCFPAQIKNKGFKRNEYITYHLEYFYISIIAVFDRLHLINFIYDFKIKHHRLSLKSLNEKLDDNNLKKSLNDFNYALKGVRKKQNTIKHQHKHKDDKLYHLSLAELLSDNDVLYKDVVKDQHWFYHNEKKEKLTQIIEALNAYVLDILEKLAPVLSLKINDF